MTRTVVTAYRPCYTGPRFFISSDEAGEPGDSATLAGASADMKEELQSRLGTIRARWENLRRYL